MPEQREIKNSQLVEAFAALSAAERREFGRFVQSPFFNRKEHLLRYFSYLQETVARGETPAPAAAHAALHPGEPFDDARLRAANTALLALLDHYWVYRERFDEPGRDKTYLAAACRKRGLDKHFRIALREARQALDEQPWRDADYYHDRHRLEWEQYQYTAATQRTEALNLQAVSDQLDQAFLVRKLRLACLARSHQAVYQADYRLGLLDAALDSASALLHVPAVALYYHCYRFLTDPGASEHFRHFRALLPEHAAAFPPDERRALYLLAVNFGIKQVNEGRLDWLRPLYELYQSALEGDLLLENGRLSRFAFNNIVAVALRAGEIDWAEQFILQYKPRLERRYREASASLGLARVAYARRDPRAALQHLQRADYSDLINNLTAKTLQLKIFYETGAFDLLESHLDSLQTYLRRHTAIGYHRTNYSRIVHYTRKLMRLHPNQPGAAAQLRQAIEQEPVLSERDWLLAMLERALVFGF